MKDKMIVGMTERPRFSDLPFSIYCDVAAQNFSRQKSRVFLALSLIENPMLLQDSCSSKIRSFLKTFVALKLINCFTSQDGKMAVTLDDFTKSPVRRIQEYKIFTKLFEKQFKNHTEDIHIRPYRRFYRKFSQNVHSASKSLHKIELAFLKNCEKTFVIT